MSAAPTRSAASSSPAPSPTRPGGRPLGIEFSQSDLFFGVRKGITSRVPRFVWNDNAAGDRQ